MNQEFEIRTPGILHPEGGSSLEIAVSQPIQEIIAAKPGWMLRHASGIIILVLIGVIFILSLIPFPDTLEGPATITTSPLPLHIHANNTGRLQQLFCPSEAEVQEGQALAELQNSTGYSNIQSLEFTAKQVEQCNRRHDLPGLEQLLSQAMPPSGEAQSIYNQLIQAISAYLLTQKNEGFKERINTLQHQQANYQAVSVLMDKEHNLQQAAFKDSRERFDANEQLYREKIISRQEYLDELARLRQKQLDMTAQQQSGLQNQINAGDNYCQLTALNFEAEERGRLQQLSISEALRNLNNFIQSWKQQFIISAPYAGVLHYLGHLQVNAQVMAGEELFALVPSRFQYKAEVFIPIAGSGKMKPGQKVQLFLDQFPASEYGYLEGTLESISAMPGGVGNEAKNTNLEQVGKYYRAAVCLGDTLRSSQHQLIPFSPEMPARARVITKKQTVLRRILNGLNGWRQ